MSALPAETDVSLAPAGPGTSDQAAAEASPRKRRAFGIGALLAMGWLGLITVLAVLAPVLPLDDPLESVGAIARKGPGSAPGHILGGDSIGRDMLSRTIHGARASLLVGVTAVLIGLLIGGAAGLLAGYFRGRFDTVLTGTFDILLAFPSLVLALALVAFLKAEPEAGTKGLSTVTIVIIALGIVSIPILARITRANTLTWAQREFVLAARAQGAKNSRIIIREVLPNVMPAMFSIALLGMAVAIIAEGGLSLLGVGVELPKPSWGNMIAEGRGSLRNAPHIVFVPAIAIFLTVLALNYMGDVIRTRFDVRESAL